MKRTDEYQKGMQDAMKPFNEKVTEQAETLRHFREHMDDFESDIIDCIKWNLDNPEELVKNLKAKKAKRSRPQQFRISIVYSGKENEYLADALRKDLNNQNNSCEKVEYVSFTKNATSLVDYRIYIGNPEKVSEENCRILYKAYGMCILQMNSSYVVDYEPKHKFTEDEKEAFISYYESVIRKSMEKSKAAENALKSRKKRKTLNHDPSTPKVTNAAMDAIEKPLNHMIAYWEDKPIWATLTVGLQSIAAYFIVYCLTMIALLPIGIGEITLRETVENLREYNFDNKFVADAQRQILEVRLTDLIMQKQIQNIS